MRRLLLPLGAIVFGSVLLPLGARPAYACDCVPLTPDEYAQEADIVLVGTVNDMVFPIGDDYADVIVLAERYLKGDGESTITVREHGVSVGVLESGEIEARMTSTCSVFGGQWAEGKRYLLFLHRGEEGTFGTSICSGSRRLYSASDPPPGYGSRAGYAGQFTDYEIALNLPPGTMMDIANSPAPASRRPDNEEPDNDSFPWLSVIAGGSVLAGGALAAASAFLVRRRMMGRG